MANETKDIIFPRVCAGVILITGSGDNCNVLLMRNNDRKKWELPKGRMDAKDKNLRETALRELYEETGIDLKRDRDAVSVSSQPLCMDYTFKRNDSTFRKQVNFFIYQTKEIHFTSAAEKMVSELRMHRLNHVASAKWMFKGDGSLLVKVLQDAQQEIKLWEQSSWQWALTRNPLAGNGICSGSYNKERS